MNITLDIWEKRSSGRIGIKMSGYLYNKAEMSNAPKFLPGVNILRLWLSWIHPGRNNNFSF